MAAVTYGLDVVCKLEQEITKTLPKSWQEDMMFLRENNRRMHVGSNSRKLTKSIQLHYGSDVREKKDPDEWRNESATRVPKQTLGGLMRKLGKANYETITPQIRDLLMKSDSSENTMDRFVEELYSIVSSQIGSHEVMRRLVTDMRAANPSFRHPVCCIPEKPNQRTPEFGMWINHSYEERMITKQFYETYWEELLKSYEETSKENKGQWADVFEYVLKRHICDSWWRPRLRVIVDNPDTPISLCFKIEDYLED